MIDGNDKLTVQAGVTTVASLVLTINGSALSLENGGTGYNLSSSCRNCFTTLELNNEGFDTELQALAGLTSAADKGIQFTGDGTAANL